MITASPASEKGLLGSLQSSWAHGPSSAGPHPCPSQMPALPMFVHISKSMLPTPNSPSRHGVPAQSEVMGPLVIHLTQLLGQLPGSVIRSFRQQAYGEQASPGPLCPLPWWGREGWEWGSLLYFYWEVSSQVCMADSK